LAGAVFANYNSQVTTEDFSFNRGIMMVVIVVLGGMGSFTGTIIATLLLYFTENIVLKLWLPDFEIPIFYDPTQGGVVRRSIVDLWQVFFSLLLIVVILVRPQGIMGSREFVWPWGKKDGPTIPPNVPPGMPQPEPAAEMK
jgi:branched-chain amino acid transport system permease protein